MATIPPEFWSTSAQTLPVLALAQILEARAIIARWGATKWNGIQRFMVALWIPPLVAYAWTTPICFNALRGVDTDQRWAQVITWSINLGMGILVLSPALNFLMIANARPLARMVTYHPIIMLKTNRSTRELLRRNEEQRQRVENLIAVVARNLSELGDISEETKKFEDTPVSILEKIEKIYADGAEINTELEEVLKSIKEASIKTEQLTAESVQRRKEALDKTEVALRASFLKLDVDISATTDQTSKEAD
ncbi:hypothetical protein AB0P21_34190 [Kribbella sp. NPDC056861]|uniref:hypothetical protein n=1 Tax=Kribbella sp. NPDC056861 TaxID=3154857 RepID=UPI00341C4BFB